MFHKKVILSNDDLEPDFTIYGFSDSPKSLVLKITGPNQKVVLQKKKLKSLVCGHGTKQVNSVIQVFFTIIQMLKITRLIFSQKGFSR